MDESTFRLRVCYRKQGRLRYLSHLELIHAQERMVRRARLPFAVTNGFSPHMKIAFGPALGVGTGGLEEYLDLWLTEYRKPDEALLQLKDSAVDDLAPQALAYVSAHEASLAADLTISHYRMTGKATTTDVTASPLESLTAAADEIERRGSIEVSRRKPNKKGETTRTLDLSHLLYRPVSFTEIVDGDVVFDLWTRFDNAGALRPEVFSAGLAKVSGIDLDIVDIMRLEQYCENKNGILDKPL